MATITNVDFNAIDLWDKVINVDLIDGQGNVTTIETPSPSPSQGRKPTMRLKGQLIPDGLLTTIELRITNLYLPHPLSDYDVYHGGSIRVSAGYRNSLMIAFNATCQVAYQELPGPDGVSFFQLIIGDTNVWTTTQWSDPISSGTMLSKVVTAIAGKLGLTPIFSYPDQPIKQPIQFTGLVKDLIPHIERMFINYDSTGNFIGLKIIPYNDQLLACRYDQGHTADIIWRLNYMTSAKHTAYGYEIQAPWVPGIKPLSLISIDPRYFRETFGGAAVGNQGNIYSVKTMEFDFCTTDRTNFMSLVAIET